MIIINNYIWIFGENQGLTANNNSYYLWKYAVNIKDDIEKYFVLDKTESNKKIYNALSKYEKKFILWKNSLKHHRKFKKADLFFITHNPNDIAPVKLINQSIDIELTKPIIHLQSGVQGIEKVSEKGNSYENNIFRYLLYNKNLHDNLIEENGFRDYQLYYQKFQPKFGDLIIKNEKYCESQIFWFLTYREYLNKDSESIKSIISVIKKTAEDEQLISYLKKNNLKLKICTHVLMEKQFSDELSHLNTDIVEIVKQENIDLNEEISKSKLLITDYSSLIYDFSMIGKKYILFQPDFSQYCENRELYLKESCAEAELIERIINENYINEKKLDDAELEYLKENTHLKELYEYFKKLQKNNISFLGYNFYGIGGTVNATMALAESLLNEGYLVNVISLKKLTNIKHTPPVGLNMQYMTWDDSKSVIEKFKRRTHRSDKYYHYLNYDTGKVHVHPYVGYALDKLMKKIKAKTVVSTRESLHLFLNDCTSEKVKNKIFFFHTIADIIPVVFPDLIDKLSEIDIQKAIFISESNRIALKEKFGFDNYSEHLELGNTLVQSNIIERDEIKSVEKKDKYRAIYLLRIDEDRKGDINNLINFGKYVKDNEISFIEIDVFGDGNYVDEFIELIEKNNLNKIIHYKQSTTNATDEIRKHDLMIDFTLNHSFGMTYIEAVLNGKKVFCMKNTGSELVMENVPDSYIESDEWLCGQIKYLNEITADELKENYDKISCKFSQKTVAHKFLDFIEE